MDACVRGDVRNGSLKIDIISTLHNLSIACIKRNIPDTLFRTTLNALIEDLNLVSAWKMKMHDFLSLLEEDEQSDLLNPMITSFIASIEDVVADDRNGEWKIYKDRLYDGFLKLEFPENMKTKALQIIEGELGYKVKTMTPEEYEERIRKIAKHEYAEITPVEFKILVKQSVKINPKLFSKTVISKAYFAQVIANEDHGEQIEDLREEYLSENDTEEENEEYDENFYLYKEFMENDDEEDEDKDKEKTKQMEMAEKPITVEKHGSLSKYIALDTNLSSCSTIRACRTDLMKISKIKQKDKNKNNYNISEQLELISQNSKNRTLENSNILEQNLKIINKIQYGKFIKFYLINSIIKIL